MVPTISAPAAQRHGPMHQYRMRKLIVERGKNDVVNIRSSNSIQQTVQRLERDGLIEAGQTERVGGRPARTVYHLTPAGRAELFAAMYNALAIPAREYPLFPAALSFMTINGPAEVARMLRHRDAELRRALEEQICGVRDAPQELPRVFLIENDYTIWMARAEIAWVKKTLAAIESRELTWDTQELIDRAAQYERGTQDGEETAADQGGAAVP
ncbi:helix-turn-helix transcriptional regulator [Nocardia sp. CS682]|uniref:helix-turn-helix transcriptional regulator n=1 Tax=Nocardia sp. CS682 TaxID=1047172 RepID=UPI0010754253|nr:helix-turn-helix transcriptional regulator [Nocardia sp. CS682]QBS46584.1 PadR family transcriptional regulator [Nocardia sp. CS682]